MGPPPNLPGLRCDVVLRFFAEPAREQARTRSSGHPVISSAEPGERWLYCYPDDVYADY
jgi:hypothetical protein